MIQIVLSIFIIGVLVYSLSSYRKSRVMMKEYNELKEKLKELSATKDYLELRETYLKEMKKIESKLKKVK